MLIFFNTYTSRLLGIASLWPCLVENDFSLSLNVAMFSVCAMQWTMTHMAAVEKDGQARTRLGNRYCCEDARAAQLERIHRAEYVLSRGVKTYGWFGPW